MDFTYTLQIFARINKNMIVFSQNTTSIKNKPLYNNSVGVLLINHTIYVENIVRLELK